MWSKRKEPEGMGVGMGVWGQGQKVPARAGAASNTSIPRGWGAAFEETDGMVQGEAVPGKGDVHGVPTGKMCSGRRQANRRKIKTRERQPARLGGQRQDTGTRKERNSSL